MIIILTLLLIVGIVDSTKI